MNTSKHSALSLTLILLLIACAYWLAFFPFGGVSNVSQDGTYYLGRAAGESVMLPFNIRVLGPILARILAHVFGITAQTAFHLLTPLSLCVSIAVLILMLRKLECSISYRNMITAAFGLQIAVMYGGTPVLVDPLLIMFATCACAALVYEKPGAALLFVCLASMTKEYGVIFVLPVALYWWKNNKRLLPLTLVPVVIFAVVFAANLTTASGDPPLQRLYMMLTYHPYLIRRHGLVFYLKTVVYQSWAILWPVMAGAITVLILKRPKLSLYFGSLLIAFPVLMLTDWDRILQPCVPFAALALSGDRFAQKNMFQQLVLCGSAATAALRLTASLGDTIWRTSLSALTLVVSLILLLILVTHFIRQWQSKRLEPSQAGAS